MTNMPEAKLAREAEMCYATVAMVTDYDCWHPDHEHVTVEKVIAMVGENAAKARSLIKTVAPLLSGREDICHAGCHRALDGALITAHAARDPKVLSRPTPLPCASSTALAPYKRGEIRGSAPATSGRREMPRYRKQRCREERLGCGIFGCGP